MEKKSNKSRVSLVVKELDEKDTYQVQASGTQVDNIACLAMAVKGVSAKSGLSVSRLLSVIQSVLSQDKLFSQGSSSRKAGKQKEVEELVQSFVSVLDTLFGGK